VLVSYAEERKKMNQDRWSEKDTRDMQQDDEDQASPASMAVFVAYCIVSSTMLLFNKACMAVLSAPCTVTLLQVTVTTVLIGAAWCCSLVEIQTVDRALLSQYVIYALIFVLGINFTMRSLAITNVETVLLFRSCSPVLVSFIDTLWLGREMPSRRSFASMLCIVLGATWFAASELQTDGSSLDVPGVCVNSMNLLLTATLMTWGKHVTDSSDVNLTTSVFVCNLTSIVPMLALVVLEKEHLFVWQNRRLSEYDVIVLGISCVIGTALIYLGWKMRTMMSATSFTVVGVLNKVLTIVLNGLYWPDHAMWWSTLGLLVSLGGGSFYQQAARAC
jgi:GDP-mannose transporter